MEKKIEERAAAEQFFRDSLRAFNVPTSTLKKLYIPKSQVQFNRLKEIEETYATLYFGDETVITTTFKVVKGGDEFIYAFITSRKMSEGGNNAMQYIDICLGAPLSSCDGEYRGNLYAFERLHEFVKFSELLLRESREKLHDRIVNEEILIKIEHYCPDKFNDLLPIINADISRKMMPENLFILFNAINFIAKSESNHINERFVKFPRTLDDISPKLVDQTIDLLFLSKDDLTADRIHKHKRMELGQKLSPITQIEAYNLGDISFPCWRELYIDSLVSKLIVNQISTGFAIPILWRFVHSSSRELFDNEQMHKKFDESDIAEDIVKIVKQANKLSYIDEDEELTHRNEDFEDISYSINDVIFSAKSNIVLSDYSLCKVSEHVGNTFRDIPADIIKGDSFLADIFKSEDKFDHFMFSAFYSLHCLHTRLGVLHTDLHANNITYLKHKSSQYPLRKDDGICVYHVKNVGTFRYSTMLYQPMIIDFSRAIIFDEDRIKADFGALKADQIMNEQQGRLAQTLKTKFPKLHAKFGPKIREFICDDFQTAAKVFSCIDYISVCWNLREVFGDHKDLISTENSNTLSALLDNLLTLLEEALDNFLDKKAKDYKLKWPCEILMKKFFGRNIVANFLSANVVINNVLNSDNDVIYAYDNFDRFPLWLKITVENINKYAAEQNLSVDREADVIRAIDELQSKRGKEKIAEDGQDEYKKLIAYKEWRE